MKIIDTNENVQSTEAAKFSFVDGESYLRIAASCFCLRFELLELIYVSWVGAQEASRLMCSHDAAAHLVPPDLASSCDKLLTTGVWPSFGNQRCKGRTGAALKNELLCELCHSDLAVKSREHQAAPKSTYPRQLLLFTFSRVQVRQPQLVMLLLTSGMHGSGQEITEIVVVM